MGQNQSGYWPSKIQQISPVPRTHPRPIPHCPHSNAAWPRGTKANILRHPHHHQTRLGSRPLHTSSGEVWGIKMKNISERKVKRWLIRINRYDTFRSENVKNSSGTVSKKNIATETPNLFSHWKSKVHLQLPRYIYIILLVYIYYLIMYMLQTKCWCQFHDIFPTISTQWCSKHNWSLTNCCCGCCCRRHLPRDHLLFYDHVSERHSR